MGLKYLISTVSWTPPVMANVAFLSPTVSNGPDRIYFLLDQPTDHLGGHGAHHPNLTNYLGIQALAFIRYLVVKEP